MTNFALLPPEINSTRLYTGAGAGPLAAAAESWSQIATELSAAASAHSSTINGLLTVWRGPSSSAMAQSSTAFTTWLTSTAIQAEHTAAQALAAVAAYELAFAETVPPEIVAANRALLAALVATNFLGINTAAIAAVEAQYVEFWAQDAAAMYAYQAASVQATKLTRFASPPQIVHELMAPATTSVITSPISILGGQTLPEFFVATFQSFMSSGPYEIPFQLLSLFTVLWGVSSPGSPLSQAILNSPAFQPQIVVPPLLPAPASGAAPSTITSVSIGSGNRIGSLTVPPDWARPVPGPSPVTPSPGPAAALNDEPLPVPLPMGLPRGGTPLRQEKPQPEYGAVVRFIPRPPAAG